MSNTPKTCATCGHKTGLTTSYGKCAKTGYYTETQRKYPTGGCDADFSGWTPRPGIVQRVKALFFGWATP